MEHKKEISTLLNAFPDQWKSELPVPFFHARHNYSRQGSIISEPSKNYNTKQLACYWFYKPISLMHKTLD
jgi:hypothetical protein